MTLPQTTPPPVIGYAGAEAIQLDLRALARIRLGTLLLIAYLASSLVRMFLSIVTFAAQSVLSVCFALCLAVGVCLLASNTRLPSDRRIFRRFLVAAAFTVTVAAIAHAAAMYAIFGNGTSPNTSKLWILNTLSPFSITAYGTVHCLCFLRLADLSRRFHARAIATQCLVVAVIFLALYTYYLTNGLLVRYIGVNSFRLLTPFLSYFRVALSLWAATFLAILLPRLKPHLPS